VDVGVRSRKARSWPNWTRRTSCPGPEARAGRDAEQANHEVASAAGRGQIEAAPPLRVRRRDRERVKALVADRSLPTGAGQAEGMP
jgi:hypothetical protein